MQFGTDKFYYSSKILTSDVSSYINDEVNENVKRFTGILTLTHLLTVREQTQYTMICTQAPKKSS